MGAGFWALGATFGREAAVGVILVVGLAVNQTILLVDAALEGRRNGKLDRPAVVAAADDRSGMIVLVTLTTLASLIPLAVGTDADSLFGSIALATAGGTLAGTMGAMVVVPAMLGGGLEGEGGWTERGRSVVRLASALVSRTGLILSAAKDLVRRRFGRGSGGARGSRGSRG